MISSIACSFFTLAGVFGAPTKGWVMFFISSDCPISNAYAPEIKRIIKKYGTDFKIQLVYTDASATAQLAQKHLKEYDYQCAFILDANHVNAKKYKVTTVPTVVLVNVKSKVVYEGRIDNIYASIGKRRPKATEFDLRNALDATLGGKPVKVTKTTAIGCFL